MALPGRIWGREKLVDVIAHAPGLARVRWIYATVLGMLGYLACG
jgi:hypothetical protein